MRRGLIRKVARDASDAAMELRGTFRTLAESAEHVPRSTYLEVLDEIERGLDEMRSGVETLRTFAREPDLESPDGTPIPRELLLEAVERMTAVLLVYLPAERANERARNIAQALADGRAVVESAVIEVLAETMADHPFNERVLAITMTRDAWIEATS